MCAKFCPKAITLCHCVLLFQLRRSFFRDLVAATENFVITTPFGNCLVSAFLPAERGPALLRSKPAIDEKRSSCNISCVWTGEVSRHGSNLFGMPVALHCH